MVTGQTIMLIGKCPLIQYRHSVKFNVHGTSFVDRDMVMRYLGLGIGHLNSADFPGDSGLLRADVLIENDVTMWQSGDAEEPDAEESDAEESDDEDRASIDNDDMYDL